MKRLVSRSAFVGASSTASAAAIPLAVSQRWFIEHTTDPKKWRNAENEEIKRRFRESNFGGLGRESDRPLSRSRKAGGDDAADESPSMNSSGTGPGVGVPLGSERINQQAFERALLEKDLTDWNQVTYVSIAMALLLIGLNLVMDVVKPVPSPEYVPYVPPSSTKPEKDGVTK